MLVMSNTPQARALRREGAVPLPLPVAREPLGLVEEQHAGVALLVDHLLGQHSGQLLLGAHVLLVVEPVDDPEAAEKPREREQRAVERLTPGAARLRWLLDLPQRRSNILEQLVLLVFGQENHFASK